MFVFAAAFVACTLLFATLFAQSYHAPINNSLQSISKHKNSAGVFKQAVVDLEPTSAGMKRLDSWYLLMHVASQLLLMFRNSADT